MIEVTLKKCLIKKLEKSNLESDLVGVIINLLKLKTELVHYGLWPSHSWFQISDSSAENGNTLVYNSNKRKEKICKGVMKGSYRVVYICWANHGGCPLGAPILTRSWDADSPFDFHCSKYTFLNFLLMCFLGSCMCRI